jgi:SNF2 family DNA or RNA helicase
MATLAYKNYKFFYLCEADENQFAKDLGFRIDRKKKLWATFDRSIALKADQQGCTLHETARPLIEGFKQNIEDSKAKDFDCEYPVPEGREYFDYQRAGIHFGLNKNEVYIADEPGLGKTIQAIGIANAEFVNSMLIMCPASLKINWEDEIHDWHVLAGESKIQVISGAKADIDPEADITIINYDIIHYKKIYDQLIKMKFDIGVLDEVHKLKNYKSKRTKCSYGGMMKWGSEDKRIKGIVTRCKKKIFLSGTPIPNYPMELLTAIKALGKEHFYPFDDYMAYGKKFCAGYEDEYGWVMTGASNAHELNTRLRSSFMIRRLKKDVTNLPPKQYKVIPVQRITEEEKNFQESMGLDGIEGMKKLSKEELAKFELGDFAEQRHILALDKLDACIQFVKDKMDVEDKVLVFAHHRDVVKILLDKLQEYNPVAIIGGMSDKAKDKAKVMFQEDPETRILIGNLQAAGEGLTLTASRMAIFIEGSWVAAEIEQCVDRVHRISQLKEVFAYFLVTKHSLEEHMMKRAIEKIKTANKALN